METRESSISRLEVILFLVLLSVLAILIIPNHRRHHHHGGHGGTRQCMATARGIVVSIRTYSLSWDGWTHPDPDYYVKLAGWPLKHEDRYSPSLIDRNRDFSCPVDQDPGLNNQGYRSSYDVMPAFRGTNIGAINTPERILAVKERVPHHSLPKDGGLAAVHAYADGTASLGIKPELLPKRIRD